MARNGDRKVAIFPDRSAPFAYSTSPSSAQCGPVAEVRRDPLHVIAMCGGRLSGYAGPSLLIWGWSAHRGQFRHPKLLRTNTVFALYCCVGQRCPKTLERSLWIRVLGSQGAGLPTVLRGRSIPVQI